MKKYIILTIIAATSISAVVIINVPKYIEKLFENLYPDAKEVDWEQLDNKTYKVDFKSEGKDYEAEFKTNTGHVYTSTIIAHDDLPEAITDILESDYSEMEIVEAKKIIHYIEGKYYSLHLESDEEVIKLLVKPNGFIFRTEKLDDEYK